jgi:Pyruvate/2-oxoacid:ferredoxin oxidoreductase gamma subunit
MGDWVDFNVAMVGATAALAGLVIVAASVNIGEIVKAPALTARLGTAIAGLVLALVVSAVGLAPAVPSLVHGAVTVAAALIAAAFALGAARRIFAEHDPRNRMRGVKSGLGFATPAAYFVGGILMLVGDPDAGAVALALGALLSVVVALTISWIVLVEVLR